MNKKTVLGLLWGVAIIFCSGCGKQAFDRQRYALIVQRPDAPAPVQTQTMLEVRPFSIDAAFATRSLTYRRTENRFETDFYHEYMAGLGAMITDQTRQWLEDSGMFSAVFTSGSLLRPTCTLEGNIAAAYLDTSRQGPSVARLEIAFYLLQNAKSNPSLIFGKRYRAEQPVPSSDIEAYMNAQHQCLTRILTELENDLANLAKTQLKKDTS